MARKGGKSTDDFILEELEDEPDKFKCEPCGLSFPDVKSKKQHESGKKHEKKLNELKLKTKEEIKTKEKIKIEESESESESEESDAEIYCKICDKYFNGYISYATHKKGSTHAKNIKKAKLKKLHENMPEIVKKNDSESEEDEELYAKCFTCKKTFSCPESFTSHVKSAKHKRKLMYAKMRENEKKDDEKDCEDEEVYKKCDLCDKSFSGIVPYQIHMSSKAHQKSVEKKNIEEKNKEFFDKTDEGYVCKECKKPFTDPLGFQNHLKNNSHEKQKAKKALAEFLSKNPEIVFTIVDEKHASANGTDSDESDELYFLVCKICKASFTGPESAQAHVKSKKHIAAVKEKKMRQLLKLKQELSSEAGKNSTRDKETTEDSSSDENRASDSKYDHKNSHEEFELI